MSSFKSLPTLEVSQLLCVSRASPKESRRTFLVPERSLEDFGHQESSICTLMNLYINFQVSTYSGSAVQSYFGSATEIYMFYTDRLHSGQASTRMHKIY